MSETVHARRDKSDVGDQPRPLTRREALLGGGLLATLLAGGGGCGPQGGQSLLDAASRTEFAPPAGGRMKDRRISLVNGDASAVPAPSPMPRLRDLPAVRGAEPDFGVIEKIATRQRTFARRDAAADPNLPRTRLISRLTNGVTPEEEALYDQLGYEGYLEYHLDWESIDDSELDALLAPLTTLEMAPWQIYAMENRFEAIGELITAQVLRSIYTRRQLHDRMAQFWTDHFNISILDDLQEVLKPVDDRTVIRRHALGTFPDLLRASAHSPAMMLSLDNYSSTVGNINENYARELMELHTMGVDGGYTQQDVIEVARCFTGWTVNGTPGESFLTFIYYPPYHDTGEKWVLGNRIAPNRQQRDGNEVLDILINHPSTAQFISGKIVRWLWGYNPPQKLVDEVTQTYVDTGGDIRAMIRATLAYDWLIQAPPKHKRPQHYISSAIRSIAPFVADIGGIFNALDALGHVPYFWPAPNGYPDSVGYWSGLLLPRWNFAADMMNNDLPGVVSDPADVVG
ncbi:MAG: DUF1800 domain-containing protein, partial [Planctomycetota bacterium]